LTALLFVIGKYLIGLYVGKSAVASSYAAAGSLVVVLLWVYYAAQVFLLGAEFTWVYATEHGSLKGTRPSDAPRKNTGKPGYPSARAGSAPAPERVSYRS